MVNRVVIAVTAVTVAFFVNWMNTKNASAEAEGGSEEERRVAGGGGAGEKAKNSIFDFEAVDIDGNVVPLNKYKGKVCLIVNVASK